MWSHAERVFTHAATASLPPGKEESVWALFHVGERARSAASSPAQQERELGAHWNETVTGRAGRAEGATVGSRAKSAGRCATRPLPYLNESAFICCCGVLTLSTQGCRGPRWAATRRGRLRVEVGWWMGGERLQPGWQRRIRPADHGSQKLIAILPGDPAGPLLDAQCTRSTPPTTPLFLNVEQATTSRTPLVFGSLV